MIDASFPKYERYKDSGVEWLLFYRNAVSFHSPGLAYSAYPGTTRHPRINPIGVVASSGIDAPPRTQPRWGIMYRSRMFQGSRCAATLRCVTESRWDMQNGGDT
jgi:hypothetical protein